MTDFFERVPQNSHFFTTTITNQKADILEGFQHMWVFRFGSLKSFLKMTKLSYLKQKTKNHWDVANPGMSKLRPAGHIQPVGLFNPAPLILVQNYPNIHFDFFSCNIQHFSWHVWPLLKVRLSSPHCLWHCAELFCNERNVDNGCNICSKNAISAAIFSNKHAN